jgi:hypothetical protein
MQKTCFERRSIELEEQLGKSEKSETSSKAAGARGSEGV